MNIKEELIKISDKEYASFVSRLTPNVDPALFLGVRIPNCRSLAKKVSNTQDAFDFLNELPHRFYDENILHALLINEIKDYDELISCLDKFLPFIDNWAVNDIIKPKAIKKHMDEFIIKIKEWISCDKPYHKRFCVSMLMTYYLDDYFSEEYLDLASAIKSDEYYVKMMVAWFFATSLSKKYDETIKYIENNCLEKWTHNKTIQKAIESYRITDGQKEYLRTLKRK